MIQDTYNKAETLLSSSLSDWGSTLATSDTIDPVWAQVLTDPFLRRLLLRYYSIKLNGHYYRNIFFLWFSSTMSMRTCFFMLAMFCV